MILISQRDLVAQRRQQGSHHHAQTPANKNNSTEHKSKVGKEEWFQLLPKGYQLPPQAH